MSAPFVLRRIGAGVALATVLATGAACGGSGGDDDAPDEATFCRLALLNVPVGEGDAPLLRRLDELAPEEIDAAVVVLREAAEELEELSPRSPDAIALEFEIRFRPDHIDASNAVDAFIESECAPPTTTTTADKDETKDETEVPTSEPVEPAPAESDSVGPSGDG